MTGVSPSGDAHDPNIEIAGLLLDLAETYRPAARYWGYKQASRAIRSLPEFVSDPRTARSWRCLASAPRRSA